MWKGEGIGYRVVRYMYLAAVLLLGFSCHARLYILIATGQEQAFFPESLHRPNIG